MADQQFDNARITSDGCDNYRCPEERVLVGDISTVRDFVLYLTNVATLYSRVEWPGFAGTRCDQQNCG